uniref:H(+)/Pi cotransporter n=1 Tax=Leersia perrieri TaxID=77586 RepID=A0A0D9W2I0_9ORYZ
MAGNQQLRVLQALDVARTQLYHFMAIVIAGMGFFTDAYDLFSISLVADLLGRVYYHSKLPPNIYAAVTGIALCGTVPGQLIFGWLGDKMGRKRVYGITLLLMVVSSLASGLSFSKREPKNVIAVLCFFRFWLGVSIGGDYPLSATIMSEYANKRTRGAFIAAVFAMQGFGNLASGIVGMIVSTAFKDSHPSKIDYAWRIVLMFGAIPAALTFYWRMKMPETARYTALITKNAEKATMDMSAVLNVNITPDDEAVGELARQGQYGLFSVEFLHQHGLHLLGTTVCWFVLDVAFYSLNIFMKDIFMHVHLLPRPDWNEIHPLRRMITITALQTLIVLCGTLPGYFFTVAFIDRIGRVKIQLIGFTMMTVFMLGLAIPYYYWINHSTGFAIMYAFTFFFANFGPNTTTFIIPAEIFPARLRSTCHGISGAVGKLGAIVGVFCFLNTDYSVRDSEKNYSIRIFLFVLTGCNLVGFIFTLLLPESKGRSLEDLTGEIVEADPSRDANEIVSPQHIHTVLL